MLTPEIFTSVINSYLPEPHASLLNGILFGVPLKVSGSFYQQLKNVGLLHIVVLSGTNITLLSSVVTSLTLFLGRRVSCLITILTIILFVAFVGPQAPSIRAAFMGILTLVAILYGRKYLALYSLFLAGLFILAFWPDWITTISFQLSFMATLGIILLGSTKIKKGWFNHLWHELKPSLAAQIFTIPVVFIYFKQISLVAPLTNLLVSGTIAPIMVLGSIAALLGRINWFFGVVPAMFCYGLLTFIIFVIEFFSKLTFASLKF